MKEVLLERLLHARGLGKPAGALVALVVLAAACGSSGPVNKAEWTRAHGAALASVNQELALSRQALDVGDRQSILAACGLLSDDVVTARKGLPVPDKASNTALSAGLNSAATAASDCLHGAQVASNASLNERAMAELATAASMMAAANQALAAWG